MKVGSVTTKICKSKTLKNGLELAANNGALFVAGSQLALATVVRPLSIATTPKTDKENKKLACAKSFASSLVNYLMVLGVSMPIANNVKKIDATPEKYLKPETINKMKEGTKPLIESKSYQFATQMFKLGANTLTAVPRAIITCALIPPIMALIQHSKQSKQIKENQQLNQQLVQHPTASINMLNVKTPTSSIHGSVFPPSRTSFKGNLAKEMGKVIDSQAMQKASEKLKDSNFQMHTMAITDTLTTLTLCHQVNNNKNIDDNRKKTLNYNAGLATSLGILSGYVADKALDKPVDKFIKKFSEVNKHEAKLSKYVEGIKIAKPVVVYGGIYYTLIPMASTFFAERLSGEKKKN